MFEELNICELIQRCQLNEADAWEGLRMLIEPAVRWGIRRRLWDHKCGDPFLGDEIAQEFFLWLRGDFGTRMQHFQGDNTAALTGYLRATAARFADKYLATRSRREMREARASLIAARADYLRASESDVLAALDRLLAAVPECHRSLLEELLDAHEERPEEATREARRSAAGSYRAKRRRGQFEAFYRWCVREIL